MTASIVTMTDRQPDPNHRTERIDCV
ncbi:hypothetical protein CURTO8I2_150052 [Curtobacterium sp. 8I-2]|nr:hypothetical protein CURTO8I2_150052 [Curtobacterium sp. 8I-2]